MDQSTMPPMVDKYARHNEIRALISAVIQRFRDDGHMRYREWQIFREALGRNYPGLNDIFLKYLHDVSTCPELVIRWCEKLLRDTAPDTNEE